MNKKYRLFVVLAMIFVLVVSCNPDLVVTGPQIEGTWQSWESYQVAGWSEDKVAEIKTELDSSDSAALIVVYKGKILFAWGNYKYNYLTHSMRKSFMSAVYGIYVDRGILDLSKTMADLGIDDVPALTEDEKKAKIIHLIKARSGVYHTAAAETTGMHNYKPERGTFDPDEFWCYNNWDFNTLATIFDQESGTDFFDALYQDLLLKLGVEDYYPQANDYSYQFDRSLHPAYGFKISARDSARFGLLFLQNGQWNDQQIVSDSWVRRSTAPVSDAGAYIPGTFYGYMWWIYPKGFGENSGLINLSRCRSYAALGAYGQVIYVIPDEDLVLVHRVDSFRGENVSMSNIYKLFERILDAKE